MPNLYNLERVFCGSTNIQVHSGVHYIEVELPLVNASEEGELWCSRRIVLPDDLDLE